MQDTKIILEAIALKKCVRVVYNRMAAKIAPHILYTRHGELYLDAVTVEREGKPPREVKVSTFKVTGLTGMELADDSFHPESIFDPENEKYAGVTLFAVEA